MNPAAPVTTTFTGAPRPRPAPRTERSGSPPAKAAAPTTTISAPASTTDAEVAGVDAAVDLDRDREPPRPDRLAEPPDLVEARGEERLPGEAGVDRHHEHEVDLGQDLLERADGGRGVEHHPGPHAALAEVVDGALQVGERLDVHADRGGARVGEGVEVPLGALDHEVHVDGQPGGAPAGLDHHRAEADVRDEPAVHHVDVDDPGPAPLDGGDLVGQVAEVGGEDRGGEDHEAARLTSRATDARAETRCPAAGSCRSTMPGATPG